ncbi:MAG: hypothetical protein Q4G33_15275, partial [bacterium]|nr:hypothetical protein [bacterium]
MFILQVAEGGKMCRLSFSLSRLGREKQADCRQKRRRRMFILQVVKGGKMQRLSFSKPIIRIPFTNAFGKREASRLPSEAMPTYVYT